MTNLVFVKEGMRMVDYNGNFRILSEEEEKAYYDEFSRQGAKILWGGLIVFVLLVNALCDCGNWIYKASGPYAKRSSVIANYCIKTTTKDLNKKEIKIRAIIPDNANPLGIEDHYIANLLMNSNYDFDKFFSGTTRPMRQGITIFFIDQEYWDGEKICGFKSGGCNLQDEKKNLILIPLYNHLETDLKSLNHERAHAYFLNKQEIVAHLIENLFSNGFDLSSQRFNLYKDDQGKLRFKGDE